jgi:hypothetical protein
MARNSYAGMIMESLVRIQDASADSQVASSLPVERTSTAVQLGAVTSSLRLWISGPAALELKRLPALQL